METLIIGYGNTIRRDDGAGPAVAEMMANQSLPGVQSRWVHQLTPDLAAEIATVDCVFFVDAILWTSDVSPKVQIQSLEPYHRDNSLGHHCDPRSLLALSGLLYDRIPHAYWVLIPAVDFEFGETFSEVTQMAIPIAVDKITYLCNYQSQLP